MCRKSTLPRSVTRVMRGPTPIFTLLQGPGMASRRHRVKGRIGLGRQSANGRGSRLLHQCCSSRSRRGWLLSRRPAPSLRLWQRPSNPLVAGLRCTAEGRGPARVSQVAGEAGLRPAGQILGVLQVDAQHAAAAGHIRATHVLPASPDMWAVAAVAARKRVGGCVGSPGPAPTCAASLAPWTGGSACRARTGRRCLEALRTLRQGAPASSTSR